MSVLTNKQDFWMELYAMKKSVLSDSEGGEALIG